jgi:hypothetical protein
MTTLRDALLLTFVAVAAASASEPSSPIPLTMGLPATAKESQALFDELDYQRACQAYLWALPIVSVAQFQAEQADVFGATDSDLVVYTTYRDKLGILTANATTPYVLAFPNLQRTGPLVMDYPAGPTAGGIGGAWQRPLTDVGQTGPDQGKGAKYLIVGPGQEPGDTTGYTVVESPTFTITFGTRVLDPDPENAKALLDQLKIYPLSTRANPPPTRLLTPQGKPWSQVQPRGLDYWKRLHAVLQIEPVAERDRVMMDMLAPLGIEKGKPFAPDDRQKKLLVAAAERGELMAMNLSFNKRFDGVRYRPDTHWDYVLTFDPGEEPPGSTDLDRRSAWFYEAFGSAKGMATRVAGVGQAYLGTYHDRPGNWLDGGRQYVLHVPPDPPAKQFWSLTLYDTRTRGLIDNPQQVADKSSRMPDLSKNADGSVDLYMGPTAPKGKEKNWIPTIPGKAWFAYFRLYAPTEAYLDASWKLPDIELAR